MQLYLRITFIDVDSVPHFTFFIPSDRAGVVNDLVRPLRDEMGWVDGSYIIRHELLDEKILRYLESEPRSIHEYGVCDENMEWYMDRIIASLESVEPGNLDTYVEFHKVLHQFHEDMIDLL